jgi:hypothetical protein
MLADALEIYQDTILTLITAVAYAGMGLCRIPIILQ